MARGRAQRGYVLILVLAVVAALAVIAARFAARIDAMRVQVASLRDYAEAQQVAVEAKSRMLFVLATNVPQTDAFGIGEKRLRADGTPYRVGNAIVSLQDERGLPSLNLPDRNLLARLLVELGVDGKDTDGLLDVLEDYTDLDNLKRLNGAEAADYAALGLPPPRNDWLFSPEELGRMPGWRDRPELVARMARLSSARRDTWFNPLTAPREVLRAVAPALPESALDAYLFQRRQSLQSQLPPGLALRVDDLLPHVGDFLRLTIRPRSFPFEFQYNLRLSPDAPVLPWQITDARVVPHAPSDANNAPEYPEFDVGRIWPAQAGSPP
ncbi:hypothetical protein GCM10025771_25680 [Niveibacterium umoris]|uniref:Type II secretory pathway component PulK n=2 Tax=Niveibacterium umoris TaxID=1193620 RepID=A0A840BIS6_9RHOO|nr:type II secretion system protein GspK [Niveibacterium umoris]MBB4012244.1 type II secretory pathway component PulK [Niveibacterium umoris]